MNVEPVRFGDAGQPELEGRLALPPRARGAVVLCHAYPPMGGSMSNAPIVALWRSLCSAGWATLRFNFRGVGRSEGQFDGGYGETRDALAALRLVRERCGAAPAALVGWSFGSIVALRAAAEHPDPIAYAGIAPPVSAGESLRLPLMPDADAIARVGPRALLVCGTEDSVSLPEDVRRLATAMGAATSVVEGADHFFEGRRAELAQTVGSFLAGRLLGEEQEPDRGGEQ